MNSEKISLSNMSLSDAVKYHRELWGILEKSGFYCKNPDFIPELRKFWNKFEKHPRCLCFMCEYTDGRCIDCPLDWGYYTKIGEGGCCRLCSEYDLWEYLPQTDIHGHQSAAKAVRNLPLRDKYNEEYFLETGVDYNGTL